MFLDETDLNRFFHHNIFENSQCHHRIARVSKSSNKKGIAIKFHHFCDLTTQQRYILQKKMIISRSELCSLMKKLRKRPKTSDQAHWYSQNPSLKPKMEIGSTKSMDNLSTYYYKDIIE